MRNLQPPLWIRRVLVRAQEGNWEAGQAHDLATELQVGEEHGLKYPSYINCDQLVRIEKNRLTDYVGSLPAARVKALNRSLRVALDLE